MEHPSDTTVVIKTFERPACVNRLVAQLCERYPELPIIIVDDSENYVERPVHSPFVSTIRTTFDIGVSAGRNLGFAMAQTKYVFTCDDDNVLTEKTDLALAEKLLRESRLDMLGVQEDGCDYFGSFEQKGDTVRYTRDVRDRIGDIRLYDFIPNLFIATKEAVTIYPWDPELKTGEHFAYFLTHKGKLQVGYTEQVSMAHAPETNEVYAKHRNRSNEYVKQFMRNNKIKRRIDLAGNVIEV